MDNQHQEPVAPKSEHEISDYLDGVKELEKQGYETGIKKARIALWVTAALVLLGEVVGASMASPEFTPLLIGIIAVEVGIFVGLALLTKTKPFAAIIIALVVYIGMWIASIVIMGGEAAVRGIVIKMIIIVTLITAIKPAKAWEDLKKAR